MLDDLIEKAADIIETNGWHQHELWPGARVARDYAEGDPVCVVGALRVAAGSTSVVYPLANDNCRMIRLAVKTIDKSESFAEHAQQCVAENVVQYNDAVATDSGDIVDLLKSVVKEIRNGR